MLHIPEKKTPILIVDDDTGFLLTIKEVLVSSGMPEPALVSDSRQVMSLIETHGFKFVLLDLLMPHLSGLKLLEQIKKSFYHTECVIVTASNDIDSAVSAMKIGAYDYLTKPVRYEKLIILIKRALERYCLRQGLSLFERKSTVSDLANPDAFKDMVAQDPAMARVLHQVEMVAPTDYSVVITGESGTGKEMLAKKIHTLSNRSDGPFVAVNMGAVSETLFKDELFGHTKGAYTGALADKKGFFESAGGGTLFLDEITDLDISLQGGLLRVIQEKEFYRVGSTRTVDVDTRILVATNKDLLIEIKKGRFRADLFHRLNMFHIDILPLRERKEDILPLARLFLNEYATATHKEIQTLSKEMEDYLLNHAFAGNVRELKNMIASAVLMEKTSVLSTSSIEPEALRQSTAYPPEDRRLWSLSCLEEHHIRQVLETVGGNRTKAAKILGIGRKTLQRKLKAQAEFPS
ncbi:MAG: sigma-54 dependent transcriptional regulator [Proteobacteria bacterium]|nr:sigma-54 dependent transcriptional regulator [Pseudomonadota bacterium]MBU1584620.1 sigma-54 dependent transcriptional regulator [Pseudomonadota bacterium]MBU2455284.1 sigma-54 dependent transcriptional regulator [Pseudomonadota bacterium]MBU2627001.1 sigma-54 dependent transcriptional regulator [Pseudomonadota bacterium]